MECSGRTHHKDDRDPNQAPGLVVTIKKNFDFKLHNGFVENFVFSPFGSFRGSKCLLVRIDHLSREIWRWSMGRAATTLSESGTPELTFHPDPFGGDHGTRIDDLSSIRSLL